MSNYLLKDLKEAIAGGQALVVVGTGVSRIATDNAPAAAWDGLLELGIQRCLDIGKADAAWADRRRADLKSGSVVELLGVASQVEALLGAPDGGEYRRWLRETVGALHPVNRDVLEALASLGVPLATTNYDGLLEEATGLPAVTWREGAKVER